MWYLPPIGHSWMSTDISYQLLAKADTLRLCIVRCGCPSFFCFSCYFVHCAIVSHQVSLKRDLEIPFFLSEEMWMLFSTVLHRQHPFASSQFVFWNYSCSYSTLTLSLMSETYQNNNHVPLSDGTIFCRLEELKTTLGIVQRKLMQEFP